MAKSNGVKITNIKMQIIESDLMVDSKTTWYSFWIMCFYYKINVILVQNNIYMEFKTDSVYDTYLVERDDDLHVTIDFTKIMDLLQFSWNKNFPSDEFPELKVKNKLNEKQYYENHGKKQCMKYHIDIKLLKF